MSRTCVALAGFVLGALAAPGPVRAAEPGYDPAPTSPIPEGWGELDLRLEPPGSAVALDTDHFCGLPCRMLLAPGEHNLRLVPPGGVPQDDTRTIEAGSSLLLEGSLVRRSTDGWGIALYVVGAAAMLTGIALVAADVAVNVGEARSDWTGSYVACGLVPLGVALAIWGAVRGAVDEQPAELRATTVR